MTITEIDVHINGPIIHKIDNTYELEDEITHLNPEHLHKLSHWLTVAKYSPRYFVPTGNQSNGIDPQFNNQDYELTRDVPDENLINIIDGLTTEYFSNYNDSERWFNNKTPYFDNEHRSLKSDVLMYERVHVEHTDKILMIGDIHSSFHALMDIMYKNMHMFINDSFQMVPKYHIFFLGDIVSRGPYNLELIYFILKLKINNFDRVHIINGNHEDKALWNIAGFGTEINIKFKGDNTIKNKIERLLWYLPSVIYLRYNKEYYHLSHGAFDIINKKIKISINKVEKIIDFIHKEKNYLFIKHHEDGDNKHNEKWGNFDQMLETHTNGIDYLINTASGKNVFGPVITKTYLEITGLKCIISGHQDTKVLQLMTAVGSDIPEGFTLERVTARGSKPYQLYGIIDHRSQEFSLRPGVDFIALTTSTAEVGQQLYQSCYLIMRSEPRKRYYLREEIKRQPQQRGYLLTNSNPNGRTITLPPDNSPYTSNLDNPGRREVSLRIKQNRHHDTY